MQVVVLFDKFFLAAKVLEACKKRGFSYVGAVKSNRIFTSNDSTHKRKINEYIPGLLRRRGRKNKIQGSNKIHYLAKQKGWLSKVGAINLVCSRREKEETILTLATNDATLSAKEVVEAYRNRWAILIPLSMEFGLIRSRCSLLVRRSESTSARSVFSSVYRRETAFRFGRLPTVKELLKLLKSTFSL